MTKYPGHHDERSLELRLREIERELRSAGQVVIRTVYRKTSTITGTSASSASEVEAHERRADPHSQYFTDVEAAALDARVTTAEADIVALDGRLTTAESDIAALDGRLTAAEGDITALDGRLTTAEADLAALDGRLTTAEADIAALDGRLTTAEASISDLFDAQPRTFVAASDTFLIPDSRQTVIHGSLTAEGSVLGEGELVIYG